MSRLSRREFLKGSAVLFLGIESLLGPLNKIVNWIGESNKPGNIWQRASTLESLIRNNANHPSETNQELLAAYLGFQATELELRHKNLTLAADMVNHFLYGKGEEKDISAEYEQAICQAATFPFISSALTYPKSLTSRYESEGKPFFSEQALSTYISSKFFRAFIENRSEFEEETVKSAIKIHATKQEYQDIINSGRSLSASLVVESSDSEAIFQSLHHYTLSVKGNVLSTRRIKGQDNLTPEDLHLKALDKNNLQNTPPDWERKYYPHTRILLDQPTVSIYDYYNFERKPKTTQHTYQPTAADILFYLGDSTMGNSKTYELWKDLPDSTRNWLYTTKVFDFHLHNSAALLAENKLAFNYPVTANMSLYAPVTIPIFRKDTEFEV